MNKPHTPVVSQSMESCPSASHSAPFWPQCPSLVPLPVTVKSSVHDLFNLIFQNIHILFYLNYSISIYFAPTNKKPD